MIIQIIGNGKLINNKTFAIKDKKNSETTLRDILENRKIPSGFSINAGKKEEENIIHILSCL